MCGIWFFLSNKLSREFDANLFKSFISIKNRGPENSEYKILNQLNTIIGFHRLAIKGLVHDSANQPFVHDTYGKTTYVMCNGEIYNYLEIAKKYDIELTTGSDCEILYPFYKLFNEGRFNEFINELDGEFAFAIIEVDKHKKTLNFFFGRDQVGVRPLYVAYSPNEICFSSELKGLNAFLHDDKFKIKQFPPRHFCHMDLHKQTLDQFEESLVEYLNLESIKQTVDDFETATKLIREELIDSVRSRMNSDRQFACLLSGGLDSSLISAIASQICRERGQVLQTFCIGIDENSPDAIAAKKVAHHIGSDHQTIIIPEEQWLNSVEDVIKIIESYDTTSVRASTGQYLISKWINENTDIKVVLCGELSDELWCSYIYCHNAPNEEEFQKEMLKLVNNVHFFDGQRVDRCVAGNELEARLPFARRKFIEAALSITTKLRMPSGKFKGVEKYLLREAFRGTNLLPEEILFRTKEAFSDGISTTKRSWFTILQENIEKIYSEQEFKEKISKYKHNKPYSKESLYYREIFEKNYGTREEVAKLIPYFWMPNPTWKNCENIKDPSARVLANYDE